VRITYIPLARKGDHADGQVEEEESVLEKLKRGKGRGKGPPSGSSPFIGEESLSKMFRKKRNSTS